jgi:hypothetical protein
MSIAERETIAFVWKDAFLSDAQTAVNAEVKALYDSLQMTQNDWLDWLQAVFHGWLSRFVGDTFFSTMTFYLERLMPVVVNEIKEVIGELPYGWSPEAIRDTFKLAYLDRLGVRWADSSVGQMAALARDNPEEIVPRLNEWSEKKPGKIQRNEVTRAAGGLFVSLVFSVGAGLRVKWVTIGHNCAYCNALSGKTIGQHESFLSAGDKLDPDDGVHEPMKVYSKVGHPPCHASCNCTVAVA